MYQGECFEEFRKYHLTYNVFLTLVQLFCLRTLHGWNIQYICTKASTLRTSKMPLHALLPLSPIVNFSSLLRLNFFSFLGQRRMTMAAHQGHQHSTMNHQSYIQFWAQFCLIKLVAKFPHMVEIHSIFWISFYFDNNFSRHPC